MSKQKKQETIFILITIVFVSFMAGIKLNLSIANTIIVIIGFGGLYLIINYLLNKIFAPLFIKQEKPKTTLVGKPKRKK